MEFDKEFFGNSPRQHFIGVVEDNDDPLRCGRVRVRVFATHTDDKKLLPTSTLRWMTIRTGVTGPYCHVGISTVLRQGTWVEGYWADGGLKQLGVITDVIPGVESATANTAAGFNDPAGVYPNVTGSDFHPLARGEDDGSVALKADDRVTDVSTADQDTWSQPEVHSVPSYGNNFVISSGGHSIELDDENDRIQITQSGGTFVELTADGGITIRTKGDQYIVVDRAGNLYFGGELNITSGGNINVKSSGNINIEGSVIGLNAQGL